MRRPAEGDSNLDRGFDYDYELVIWVSADKSFDEFKESLQDIIHPLQIIENQFQLGGIYGEVEEVREAPPIFRSLPDEEYRYKVTIDTNGALIWSGFSRHFVLSLALGIRTKFLSSYLITNDQGVFILYSGTNKPLYLNPDYASWKSGEFNEFRGENAVEVRT